MKLKVGSRNQLGNVDNPYQGKRKRVLCVCSAGLLRSPTMASFLTTEYGYNTRACGTNQEFALIPITHALLLWADEVHVVKEQEDTVRELMMKFNLTYYLPVTVLDIPDNYEAFSPELLSIISSFYKERQIDSK